MGVSSMMIWRIPVVWDLLLLVCDSTSDCRLKLILDVGANNGHNGTRGIVSFFSIQFVVFCKFGKSHIKSSIS